MKLLSLKYDLGHHQVDPVVLVISGDGIQPNPRLLHANQGLAAPIIPNPKEILSVLGMASNCSQKISSAIKVLAVLLHEQQDRESIQLCDSYGEVTCGT